MKYCEKCQIAKNGNYDFFFFCYDVTKRFVALFTTESELQ